MTGGAETQVEEKKNIEIYIILIPLSISYSLSTQFKASKENISFSVRTIFFFFVFFERFLFHFFFVSSKQYENYLLFFISLLFSFELLMAPGYLYPHFISCVVVTFSCYITFFFWSCANGMYVKPYLLTGNGISNLLLLYIIRMWNVTIGCM